MKRIIASVLAVSAIAAAAPAFAQPRPYGDRDRDGVPNAYDGYNNYRGGYRGYGQWQGVGGRINAIERRIDVGIRNGQISMTTYTLNATRAPSDSSPSSTRCPP